MKINFFKYHGTGNDFIIIDNRNLKLNIHQDLIIKLCHRNFGVGADGIILIENDRETDFVIKYYNSNGMLGSLCGNGSRCAVYFVRNMGLIQKKYIFQAFDGIHEGFVDEKNFVSVKISNVCDIHYDEDNKYYFLNTGSPHHVLFVNNIKNINILQNGHNIRNHPRYSKIGGVNVNFVQIVNDGLMKVRTYERGVENETLSCGTGAVASALACNMHNKKGIFKIFTYEVITKGGSLFVSFNKKENNIYEEIWLKGQVFCVFQGNYCL